MLFSGCRSPGPQPVRGEEARKQAANFAFWQPHLLLTSDQRYRSLEIEIDHVQGSGPTAAELKSLTEFFEAHCGKPDGVKLRVDAAIPRPAARGQSHIALAELHLDGPATTNTAYAYFLFYDGRLTGLPARNPATLRIPFPGAVFIDRRYLDAASRFPGAGEVARRMILHEAGHVLGLCANQGHSDGIHCTNRDCLMNESLYVHRLALFVPGRPVAPQRDFCPDCRADLAAAQVQPPAEKLRFLGPYCVRSEPGYHVVTSPGFAFVHVGPLADLDLADVRRRRIATFTAEPGHIGITSQTAELDLPIARALIPQLARDPLECLRELAAHLQAKIAAIDAAKQKPAP